MKLKIVEVDGKTFAEVQEGRPVYVAEDGKEIAFDAPSTVATISRLNGEAKGHREAKEAAEKALKAFEGISDPAAARKALDTIANLDSKKLIDAGEVEKVKAEIAKVYEEKLTAAEKRASDLEAGLYSEKIGGSFARSKFIADKIAVPADMIQKTFGDRFKIEDGKVVAYGADGNKVYSRAKPGEPAEFEEALEIIVDTYPYKEHILRGTGSSGSGARAGNGATGGKTISRQEFSAMPPADQMSKMRDGFTVID